MRIAVSLSLAAVVSTSAFAKDEASLLGANDDVSSSKQETAAKGDDFRRVQERAPRAGTPLIANKLYPMALRFEITGMFDYSVLTDKYVDHIGGSGALTFHILDYLALEGFGGYLVGAETGIAKSVRNLESTSVKRAAAGQPCFTPTCEPQLPDMWMTTWFAGADVQWSPIYGKMSAVSEYDLNFQLYGLGGLGAEGITRLLNDTSFDTPQVRVSANYGLGIRLIPWKYLALRVELRNYNGINPNVEEHESRDEDDCSSGYTLTNGNERQCYPDISNNTMLQVGLSLLL